MISLNVLFVTAAVIVVLLFAVALLWTAYNNVRTDYIDSQKDVQRKELYIDRLELSNGRLRKEIQMRLDGEEKANEKLNELHSSLDVLSSAIDSLQQH